MNTELVVGASQSVSIRSYSEQGDTIMETCLEEFSEVELLFKPGSVPPCVYFTIPLFDKQIRGGRAGC